MPSSILQEDRQRNIFSQNETIIIFDWDDTLIPSSFLAENGLRLDSDYSMLANYRQQLQDLENRVANVLNLAMQMGRVLIVTNAEKGWVQLSSEKFLPGIRHIIDKIDVISARSEFESMFDSPLKWKFYAFQQKLGAILSEKSKENKENMPPVKNNIISFGDSHVERHAIQQVSRYIPNSTTKSVKFAERPSLEQLLRQIELVTKCFQYIYSHEGDLDLQLTINSN